jgi:hypothetical protein
VLTLCRLDPLQEDCNSTVAIALGLVALSFGLRYPSDVSVCGHLTVGGRVTTILLLKPPYVTEAHKLGIRKLVMGSKNVERLRPQEQAAGAAAGDAEEDEERAEVRVPFALSPQMWSLSPASMLSCPYLLPLCWCRW